MELGGRQLGARAIPSPNAGKTVKVRWVKHYPDATNQVCIGELVRETPEYLVMKGIVLNFGKGSQQVRRDKEQVRWIPWTQIAAVTELPSDLKWRETEFFVDDVGQVLFR